MTWPPAGRNVRVFAAAINTETNTFSPFPTTLADFTVVRPAQAAASGFAEEPGLEETRRLTLERGWEFHFGLQAAAQPAGVTTRAAYEGLRDELLERLRAALPVDLVILPLHGAMVAEGYLNCEVDLARRVRAVVGPNVPIGVSLDLHCHLSQDLLDAADVVVTYKEYPHTDMGARAADLFELTVGTAAGRVRPTMALFDCRAIGLYPTEPQPLRGFVDAMLVAEARGEALSLSLGHGFPWGDVPDQGTKLLAVTDDDPEGAARLAREWGERFYAIRREAPFRPLGLHEALDRALAAERGPVVVADQADNPGGGAPGDSTFALAALLARGATDAALGMIYDPETVRLATAAGVGATVRVKLGGKQAPGAASGRPVEADATVLALSPALVQDWPQAGERLEMACGAAAALRLGGVDVVVNDKRGQVFSPDVFTNLGIDVSAKRLLVVKSTQHFYAGFAPVAGEVVYLGGPGALAPRMTDIPLVNADTDKYPWVEDPLGLG